MSSFVNLMDIVYPVGSIYYSFSSISPATRFGGTWEQITCFLYPQSSDVTAGTSVGEATHNHKSSLLYREFYGSAVGGGAAGEIIYGDSYNADNSLLNAANVPAKTGQSLDSQINHGLAYEVTTITATEYRTNMYSTYADNIPPSITCYCWHRTA